MKRLSNPEGGAKENPLRACDQGVLCVAITAVRQNDMRELTRRCALYFALIALYLVHNDLWLWNNPRLLAGIPVGLVYHVGFCVAASLLMLALVRYAWPRHLAAEQGERNPVNSGNFS